MDDDQINLSDDRILVSLKDSLTELSVKSVLWSQAVERDATPRVRRIERALEEAQHAVRQAERNLQNADPEDKRAAEERLQEARRRFDRIRKSIDNIKGALKNYRSRAGSIEQLRQKEISSALAYLRGRIEAMREYLSLQIAATRSGTSANRLRIDDGKQGKHILGHNNFERPGDDDYIPPSQWTHPDPQGLLDIKGGTGDPVNSKSANEEGYRQRIDFGSKIGNFSDTDRHLTEPTTTGIVHYSKSGAHIVPARPNPSRQIPIAEAWGGGYPGAPVEQIALPEGFRWVPLGHLDIREEDCSDLIFSKVSAEDMRSGLHAFEEHLLPELRRGMVLTRENCLAIDRKLNITTTGPVRANSIANMYDVFFGSDSVAFDSNGSILSGRHRITIARELGWTHIPARWIGG